MKPVRFDLNCEGDIEKFARWAEQRVKDKKKTDVMLGVPNLHWPMMVIHMLLDEGPKEAPADEVFLNIDFDIKYVDEDMVLTEDDLEEMLDDMSEEELTDWIDDMLADYESSKDEDDEENEDKPNE